MEVDKDWKIFSDDTALSNIGFYGIVILNRRINIPPAKMSQLWSDACWRMTIDGGTDRWLDYVNENSLSLPLPNYVTGDFDSIRPETLQYCRKQEGITVMNTPDQDLTDFEKGLNIMVTTCTKKLDYFVVVCENSGRLDQIFSNLNTLYKSSLEGFMISKSAVSWLLRPGEHRIHIPCSLCNQDEICGILPLSKPAKVTTRGLKWNLNDSIIEFGGLISSSNTYEGTSTVQVTTDSTVVWTMTYND